MKVLVLGAGVVGVTSAYFLARQGHEVVVIDRGASVAGETSQANAGQLSFGYTSPWAAPGVPFKALKWMFAEHPPLTIRPDGTLFQLKWILQMWRNCTPSRYAINKERMVRLSTYSRECLEELRRDTGIEYEGRRKGTLQVFRTQQQLDAVALDIPVLRDAGVRYEVLSREELAKAEPALAHTRDKLVGGLRLPDDETGDCQLFTSRLAEMARELGVEFRHEMSIDHLEVRGDEIAAVQCGHERLLADAYVVALGSYSSKLLRHVEPIPVYPLKGYSITVPIKDEAAAPVSTLLDETYKIAITRFEQRIRVGGMAEIVGYDTSLNPKRRQTLEMVLDDLFPGGREPGEVSFWAGLRPKTPDSTPIVGRTRYANLYLNTGHGTLGWTMSCGSGQLIADIVSGRKTAIRSDDLSVQRYRSELSQ